MFITDNVIQLLGGSLLLAALCLAQERFPPLSVGNTLEALTPSTAFQPNNGVNYALTSNFDRETLLKIAQGAQEFGLDLLGRISHEVSAANRDFMISPFSIWSLLVLLYEGASGQTYEQLRQALRINVEDEKLRAVYRVWSTYLNVNTPTIEVASLQGLYTDKLSPVKSSYREVAQSYNVQPVEVDFYDKYTVYLINEAANRTTRGLIPYVVQPQDIFGNKMFMISSLFFKGQWKYPFNVSQTRLQPFYDETGAVVTQIPLMAQEGNFAFVSNIEGLDGYVLEMPYGEQDRLSMIVVLPKRGFTLNQVAQNLRQLGLAPVLRRIADFRRYAQEDNKVEVLMPKFTTTTDFQLKQILVQMGIKDLFDESRANLNRLAEGLFAKICIHATKIIVDEKGTSAAAVTAASLDNKAVPPKFELNRPFQYMIVEKSTSLMLFAGQVRNPKAF